MVEAIIRLKVYVSPFDKSSMSKDKGKWSNLKANIFEFSLSK